MQILIHDSEHSGFTVWIYIRSLPSNAMTLISDNKPEVLQSQPCTTVHK